MEKHWLDSEIAFYDFIWEEGTRLCATHINSELIQDFAAGGSLFQEMKQKIVEKFPTRDSAIEFFLKNNPPTL